MSDNDDDDQPKTVFLKRPPLAEPANKPVSGPATTGKLICLDTVPQEVRPDRDEYWLTRTEEVVGRGPDNSVQIQSPEVSRVHARFVSTSGKWAIEDRGSRNGVWVNGTRVVSSAGLSHGDTINLGRIAFRFEVMGADEADHIPLPVQSDHAPSSQSPSSFADTVAREPEVGAGDTNGVSVDRTDFGRAASSPAQVTRTEDVVTPGARPEISPVVSDAADLASITEKLRQRLPEILSALLEQASRGDAEAARVCLDYLVHEQQRMQVKLEKTGTISGHVKTVISAMIDHKITPKQALDILKVLETAGELLKRRQG